VAVYRPKLHSAYLLPAENRIVAVKVGSFAMDIQEHVDLVDWRRRVGDLYRLQRPDALQEFRRRRDELFRTHAQSPIPASERATFAGLRYFDPNPAFRVRAQMRSGPADEIEIDTGGEDGVIRYRRVGRLEFEVEGRPAALTVLALVAYGGGLFVPFTDATSGKETYGGGRYLFDTPKDTDGLSFEVRAGSHEVVIDFNYAYNPSCVYDVRWACPLAPPENRLPFAVRAGEMLPK
jgi:uncharacterized protein (DUF1684 family)